MPDRRRRAAARAGTVAVLALGAALAFTLWRAQGPPGGPEPVAWDREACAHCRMLLSEPRFAAQLHAEDGRVFFFDDPGCLLLWREEHALPVHSVYFHHLHEDDWVSGDDAAFVPVPEATPMGYGLGVVRRGETARPLPPAEALARARARDAGRARGGS